MSDMIERYEAEAEAFYEATGVMAPGKDSPAAMGGYDADELRHKLWRMWARAVYAERERDEARREREEADEALAACQAQASGEIARLQEQLTAMTEARDLWQREAEIQQAHRERAEKVAEAAAAWEFSFRDPADPHGYTVDEKHDALLDAVRAWREGRG